MFCPTSEVITRFKGRLPSIIVNVKNKLCRKNATQIALYCPLSLRVDLCELYSSIYTIINNKILFKEREIVVILPK